MAHNRSDACGNYEHFPTELALRLYAVSCRSRDQRLIEDLSSVVCAHDPQLWPSAVVATLSGTDVFRLVCDAPATMTYKPLTLIVSHLLLFRTEADCGDEQRLEGIVAMLRNVSGKGASLGRTGALRTSLLIRRNAR